MLAIWESADFSGWKVWLGIVVWLVLCGFCLFIMVKAWREDKGKSTDYVVVDIVLTVMIGVIFLGIASLIVSVADSRGDTKRAYQELKQQGFEVKELNITDSTATITYGDCELQVKLQSFDGVFQVGFLQRGYFDRINVDQAKTMAITGCKLP